jgi:cytochrome c2
MNLPSLAVVATIIAAGFASAAARAEDASALFARNCQTCHTLENGGASRQGPPLRVSSGARPV